MTPPAARAVRRAVLLSLAGGATLAAHVAAAGSLEITALAPLLWLGLLAVALMASPRRGGYRSHGPAGTLGRVVVVQALAHLVLHAAPWALGVAPHHESALITPAALTAHAVAALVVALLLVGVDGLLTLACALRRVVRALLGAAAAGGGPRRAIVLRAPGSRPSVLLLPAAPRGPPLATA